jgi:hypothetical protein
MHTSVWAARGRRRGKDFRHYGLPKKITKDTTTGCTPADPAAVHFYVCTVGTKAASGYTRTASAGLLVVVRMVAGYAPV